MLSLLANRAIRLMLIFVLFFFVPVKLGVGQEQKEKQKEQNFVRFQCQNETVKVDPKMGTDPKAVYLCTGATLTFDANGHKFKATFKKSPFEHGQTVFDNDHYKSEPTKGDTVLTVYNYSIIVDGHHVQDPQVVTGGG